MESLSLINWPNVHLIGVNYLTFVFIQTPPIVNDEVSHYYNIVISTTKTKLQGRSLIVHEMVAPARPIS